MKYFHSDIDIVKWQYLNIIGDWQLISPIGLDEELIDLIRKNIFFKFAIFLIMFFLFVQTWKHNNNMTTTIIIISSNSIEYITTNSGFNRQSFFFFF